MAELLTYIPTPTMDFLLYRDTPRFLVHIPVHVVWSMLYLRPQHVHLASKVHRSGLPRRPPLPCTAESLSRVDIANADGNKVAACTAMQDVATRGFLISLGGRSRIRVLSEGRGERVIEVPAPEAYALLQAQIVQAGRVTLTRAELDDLCAKVGS